jgi:hypothetical protein
MESLSYYWGWALLTLLIARDMRTGMWRRLHEQIRRGADSRSNEMDCPKEEMMNNTKAKIGVFVDRLVQDAAASGLTWDEAISAFGLASKVTALMAAESGDGTKENCVALARNRFEEAFAQPIQVVFARSDLSALREVTDEQAKAVLDNTNIRIIGRFTH